MSKQSDLLKEAKRCASEATRGVTPGHRQMFSGLSRFYESLARSELDPPMRREPRHRQRPPSGEGGAGM